MTTTVRIINDGPDDIIVSTRPPYANSAKQEVARLKPGQVSAPNAVYVHLGQTLVIEEVDPLEQMEEEVDAEAEG